MSGTQFMLDYRTEMTVYFQETIGAKHMFKSEAKEFFFFTKLFSNGVGCKVSV